MKEHPIILFDGVCNLCSRSVQFVIRHDKKAQFKFASLQGNSGVALRQRFHLEANELNSFILIEDDHVYTKSTGALRVARKLSGGWKLLYGLMIIPRFIRDGVYNLVSRKRYKWFGKKEECWLPSPVLRARFLD